MIGVVGENDVKNSFFDENYLMDETFWRNEF